MAAAAALATPALYPAILFVLEKAVKSAGNAVIPTFPAHCPHGLQHLRHKWPTFAFTGKSGYTLGFTQKIAHNGSHGETGGVSDGALSLPSTRTARSRTSPGRVSERCTLPLLGLGRGCSRRTQKACGTAMRLCASLFRGVAAPLGCVIFFASAEIAVCTSCAQCFPNVRDEGWYHYPRRALCAVETLGARLSKRLICCFLRSGGRSSPHDSYFLANT